MIEFPEGFPENLKYYKAFIKRVLHTGSRVICNPPVEDTDDDWVIQIIDGLPYSTVYEFLMSEGFYYGGSMASRQGGVNEIQKNEDFMSFKDDNRTNLIVCSSDRFFEAFEKATKEAKALNLTDKGDRVRHFQKVREEFGFPPEKSYQEKKKPRYRNLYDATKIAWKDLNLAVNPPVIADENGNILGRMEPQVQVGIDIDIEVQPPDNQVEWHINGDNGGVIWNPLEGRWEANAGVLNQGWEVQPDARWVAVGDAAQVIADEVNNFIVNGDDQAQAV